MYKDLVLITLVISAIIALLVKTFKLLMAFVQIFVYSAFYRKSWFRIIKLCHFSNTANKNVIQLLKLCIIGLLSFTYALLSRNTQPLLVFRLNELYHDYDQLDIGQRVTFILFAFRAYNRLFNDPIGAAIESLEFAIYIYQQDWEATSTQLFVLCFC